MKLSATLFGLLGLGKFLILLFVGNVLGSSEYCAKTECHFELHLQWRLTMSCLNLDDNFWYPVFVDSEGNIKHQFNSDLYPPNGTTDTDKNIRVPDFKVTVKRLLKAVGNYYRTFCTARKVSTLITAFLATAPSRVLWQLMINHLARYWKSTRRVPHKIRQTFSFFTIVVFMRQPFKDALVHVTVVNELLGDAAASIHFHGFKFGQGYYW